MQKIEGLTPSQNQAVFSESKNLLLVAGAGSGKTRTLTERITNLIQEKEVSPSEILCLTFTRKAANEMRERIALKVGVKAKKIRIGTFHSVCYSILNKWGEQIGYKTTNGDKITVATPEESDFIIGHILKEYSYKGRKKDLEKSFRDLSHKGIDPEDIDHARIIGEYKARLRECNCVDFDMILLEVNRLFKESKEALEYYQTRFRLIFVDEYQDTDKTQYNLHEILKPEFLFAVGDPDQAIYGWRGAELEIILGFERDHPGAEVIKLEECFRCGEKIVNAANSLISKNENRIEKVLKAIIPGGRVELWDSITPWNVSTVIGEDLAFENPGEIAVLARTHRVLEKVEADCRNAGIPVFRVGAQMAEVEKSLTWKIFMGYVRGMLNPNDNLVFHAWIIPDVVPDTLLQFELLAESKKRGEYYSQALFRNFPNCNFHIFFNNGKEFIRDMQICHFYEWYQSCRPNAGEMIPDHLKTLGMWESTLSEFYEWYATKDLHAELEKTKKGIVTLITCHAAKGLEWNNVILADFSAGVFPSRMGNQEEERRLAYVAFTRARKNLYLCFSEPSQYVKEASLES